MTKRPSRALPPTSDAARQDAVLADPHVVPHVHQVVDLRAPLDHRVVDAAAVDRRERPDLDIVAERPGRPRAGSVRGPRHRCESRSPVPPRTAPALMLTRWPSRARRPITTCGAEPAVVTQHHVVLQHHAGIEPAAGTQRHPGPEHHVRPDRYALAQHGAGADARRRIHSRHWHRDGIEPGHDLAQGPAGILHHDRRADRRHLGGQLAPSPAPPPPGSPAVPSGRPPRRAAKDPPDPRGPAAPPTWISAEPLPSRRPPTRSATACAVSPLLATWVSWWP